MELLQLTFFPTVLSLLFLLIFTFYLKISKNAKPKLPPGPRQLPFIGNLHNLLGPVPHHTLRALSDKYGPLMHLKLGEVSAVVVSSPKMAEAIMKTNDTIFASRTPVLMSEIMMYGTKDLAFAPYGKYWRMVRKICTLELLSKKRVQCFRRVREEQYLDLARCVASNAGKTLNLSEKIFSMSYETTSRIAFGLKCKHHDEFITVVEETLKLASGFDIGDLFPSYKFLHVISGMRPKLERLYSRSDRILEEIIEKHRDKLHERCNNHVDENPDDLVDVLLRYEQGEDEEFTLTMENVKAIIWDIFAGGSDSAATTIDWALSEMIRNPKLLRKAQVEVRNVFEGERTVNESKLGELKFLKMVIKETLRMHPPAPLLVPRECTKTCEIDEYVIPRKTKAIVNAWAINRDPTYWKDAETFDPERFRDNPVNFLGNDFEFIPFGAGRRICPGMDFGLASVKIALAMLLYHFEWQLPDGMKNADMDMTEWFSIMGKRKESLCVIPRVYRDPPSC